MNATLPLNTLQSQDSSFPLLTQTQGYPLHDPSHIEKIAQYMEQEKRDQHMESQAKDMFDRFMANNRDLADRNINDQVDCISEFFTSFYSVTTAECHPSLHVFPRFKTDKSMMNFLLEEKVFPTKMRLEETKCLSVTAYKQRKLTETKKGKSKTNRGIMDLLFLCRIGYFHARLSDNPHMAFNDSVEYRLLCWGLRTLGLPEPKKLQDIETLYQPSSAFTEQYLPLQLAYGTLFSENKFYSAAGMLGIIEALTDKLATEHATFNDQQWNAVVAALFGVVTITDNEASIMPLVINYPILLDMLDKNGNQHRFIHHTSRFFQTPTELTATFHAFWLFSQKLVKHQISNSDISGGELINVIMVLFLSSTEQIIEGSQQIIDHQDEIVRMASQAMIGFVQKYNGQVQELLAVLKQEYMTYSETEQAIVDSIKTLATTVLALDWLGLSLKDDMMAVMNIDTDNLNEHALAINSQSVTVKAFIDLAEMETATKHMATLSALRSDYTTILESVYGDMKQVVTYHKQQSLAHHQPQPCETETDDIQPDDRADTIAYLEQEIEAQLHKLSKHKDDIKKKNQEIMALKAENSRLLMQQYNSYGMSDALRRVLFNRPRSATCQDVLLAIKELYPFVTFADDTLTSVQDCEYSNAFKLFESLDLLCSEYYPQIAVEGKPDAVAKDILGNAYSQGESDTVMQSPKLRAHREFRVNGNSITVAKHLTIGAMRSPKNTVQVHFDILDKQLLIARVGKHLPVASS